MSKRARRILFVFFIMLGFILTGGVSLLAEEGLDLENFKLPDVLGFFEGERADGGYFTIKAEDGTVLDKTSRSVYEGDEFIAEDNNRYMVKKVTGDTAYASMVGKEEIAWHPEDEIMPVQAGAGPKKLIAMYNTHSDESYVPTDGTESIPARGGIFKVGDALAAKLEALGINVEYDKTPHEPHDANAYRRSRRTAAQLLKDRPAAIVDVHRDGVPDPDFYNAQVAGEPVTKVRLVVGRQNQNMQANLDFAKRLKAYLDTKNPGLVRGIFMAKGNYNQDLAPRSILVEVGTYTNDRQRAQNGASLFAEALPPVLGLGTTVSQQGPNATAAGTTGGDWKSIFWIIAVLIAGGAAFLWLSTGSWQGALDKIKQLTSREWANYLSNVPTAARQGPAKPLATQDSEPTNDARAGHEKD